MHTPWDSSLKSLGRSRHRCERTQKPDDLISQSLTSLKLAFNPQLKLIIIIPNQVQFAYGIYRRRTKAAQAAKISNVNRQTGTTANISNVTQRLEILFNTLLRSALFWLEGVNLRHVMNHSILKGFTVTRIYYQKDLLFYGAIIVYPQWLNKNAQLQEDATRGHLGGCMFPYSLGNSPLEFCRILFQIDSQAE